MVTLVVWPLQMQVLKTETASRSIFMQMQRGDAPLARLPISRSAAVLKRESRMTGWLIHLCVSVTVAVPSPSFEGAVAL